MFVTPELVCTKDVGERRDDIGFLPAIGTWRPPLLRVQNHSVEEFLRMSTAHRGLEQNEDEFDGGSMRTATLLMLAGLLTGCSGGGEEIQVETVGAHVGIVAPTSPPVMFDQPLPFPPQTVVNAGPSTDMVSIEPAVAPTSHPVSPPAFASPSIPSTNTAPLTVSAETKALPRVTLDTLVSAYGRGGVNGYNQRAPALVQIGKNELLVFNSEFSVDGQRGDGYGQRLVYRAVSFDPQANEIAVGERRVLVAPPDNNHTHNHIHAVKIQHGFLHRGRIIAMYQDMKVGAYSRIFMMHSDDDGATWSAGQLVNTLAFSEFTVLGSSGSFLEMPGGPYKGRLILPVYGSRSDNRIGLFLSDDGGTTWHLGGVLNGSAFGAAYINETAVALGGGDDLMLVSRSDPAVGHNHISRSKDAGQTISVAENPPFLAVTPTAISLLQISIVSGAPLIMWAGPSPERISNARNRARLKISRDGGFTFPIETAPFGPSGDLFPFGYSSAATLNDHTLAVAYETPLGGSANNQESVRLLIIDMADFLRSCCISQTPHRRLP